MTTLWVEVNTGVGHPFRDGLGHELGAPDLKPVLAAQVDEGSIGQLRLRPREIEPQKLERWSGHQPRQRPRRYGDVVLHAWTANAVFALRQPFAAAGAVGQKNPLQLLIDGLGRHESVL